MSRKIKRFYHTTTLIKDNFSFHGVMNGSDYTNITKHVLYGTSNCCESWSFVIHKELLSFYGWNIEIRRIWLKLPRFNTPSEITRVFWSPWNSTSTLKSYGKSSGWIFSSFSPTLKHDQLTNKLEHGISPRHLHKYRYPEGTWSVWAIFFKETITSNILKTTTWFHPNFNKQLITSGNHSFNSSKGDSLVPSTDQQVPVSVAPFCSRSLLLPLTASNTDGAEVVQTLIFELTCQHWMCLAWNSGAKNKKNTVVTFHVSLMDTSPFKS